MSKWVHLDSLVYYAGQTVTGKVVLQDVPTAVKEIKVKILGRGFTHWTESTGAGASRVDQSYSGLENYVKQKELVWTETAGLPFNDGQMHPFAFQLPTDLPPTFKGVHGDITYSIIVKFKRHGISMNKSENVPFTVIPLCSVSHMHELMEPVVLLKEKIPTTLFSKKGAISAEIHLQKQCFVIGEPIVLSGEVRNGSSVKIKLTKARLRQKMTYRAQSKKKWTLTTISKVKREEEVSPGGGSQVWSNVALPIPPDTLPSDFGPRCKLFEVVHYFEFIVDLSGMHIDMQLDQRVMLGTVPNNRAGEHQSEQLEGPIFGPVAGLPNAFSGVTAGTAPPSERDFAQGATSGLYPVIGFRDPSLSFGSLPFSSTN